MASKRKNLQTKPFWHLLTSPRLFTRSGTLLCFTNSSRSNSHLPSFFGYALSFLIVELKSRLVVHTAAPFASDEGSLWARYLVQFSSFCLLMTSLRIYLGVPMPPCMLTIWPSGPPPQTCSKHPLLSNPPSLSYKHGPTYGDFHSIQRFEPRTQSCKSGRAFRVGFGLGPGSSLKLTKFRPETCFLS